MKAYKLRNKKTGLYSSTTWSGWTRVGKVWSQKGHIRIHMALKLEKEVDERLKLKYNSNRDLTWDVFNRVRTIESERDVFRKQILAEWEIIEVELTPSPANTLDAEEFLMNGKNNK